MNGENRLEPLPGVRSNEAESEFNDLAEINGEAEGDFQAEENQLAVSTGLYDFFMSNSIGKEILKAYDETLNQNVPLPKNICSKLVRLVINREKDWTLRNITPKDILDKFVISKKRFEILGNEICYIFKNETTSTYYVPYEREGKTNILASEKLWHHFNYVKDCLREAKLISKKKQPLAVINEDIESLNNNDDLLWISSHIEPWEKCLIQWNQTFNLRRRLLMNKNLSVQNYIDKFPCLTTQKGLQILLSDFSLLYPDQPIVTDDRWKKIQEYLIKCLASTKINNLEEKVLIELLKSTATSVEQLEFLLFYLLHHIIPPRRSGKRKKDSLAPRKLSLQERRETFILLVASDSDVRFKLCELQMKNESFQPVIVAVGAPISIQKYFVAVNNILFEVSSIKEAVLSGLNIFFLFRL